MVAERISATILFERPELDVPIRDFWNMIFLDIGRELQFKI